MRLRIPFLYLYESAVRRASFSGYNRPEAATSGFSSASAGDRSMLVIFSVGVLREFCSCLRATSYGLTRTSPPDSSLGSSF
jgi:hypothetical protein